MDRNETILNLIRLYRGKEELWNMRSPLYKNVDARRQAYQEISDVMLMSIGEIKRKIKSIRSVYLAEKTKVELQSVTEKAYKPTLTWYNEMSFLNGCIVRRKIKNDSKIKMKESVVSYDDDGGETASYCLQQDAVRVDNEFLLHEHESYKLRCGEIYLTTIGRVIFHCTLCEMKFNGYNFYKLHIREHLTQMSEEDDTGLVQKELNEAEDFQEWEPCESTIKVESEILNSDTVHISCNEYCDNDMKTESIESIRQVSETDFENYIEDVKLYDSNEELSYSVNNFKIERLIEDENQKQIPKLSTNKKQTNELNPIIEDCKMLEMQMEAVRKVERRFFPRSQLISDEQRVHKCPVCGLGFKERHNMKYHLKRHTSNKDYKCSICEKAFYTLSELRVHNRVHTKERPFLCSICGRSYGYSTQLADHLKRHKMQRNHKCEICQKAFYDKGDLSEHMAGHSTERPYACEQCSASFSRQGALKNHQKLHENKREYKCKFCFAEFNQRAGLFSHMKIAHKTT